MKYFLVRTQLVYLSVILLVTFGLLMVLVTRYNARWDLTQERLFSISENSEALLKELSSDSVEIIAFYPQDDPARQSFEVFLKECRLHHPRFFYNFYDPDRVPNLAKEWQIKELYTVIILYKGHQERIVNPTEESFATALMRLARPIKVGICFVAGHGEAALSQVDRGGYSFFRDELESNNYEIREIILDRDRLPPFCNVYAVMGPHRDLETMEYDLLKQAFQNGKGIFFLIDPMDSGTGASFKDFMETLGVTLGENVIVDKMSRVVGGDFLVPLVSQYIVDHPITAHFAQPTFFPVTRSVQPSAKGQGDLLVDPLALTGTDSWVETNLEDLEKGEAVFEFETDVQGPISIAVAVERTDRSKGQTKDQEGDISSTGGRMVVVGDSDFLTNAYLDLAGNKDLAFKMIRWLSKDDRFVSLTPRESEFQPLYLGAGQHLVLLILTLGVIPLLVFIGGAAWLVWRKRTG